MVREGWGLYGARICRQIVSGVFLNRQGSSWAIWQCWWHRGTPLPSKPPCVIEITSSTSRRRALLPCEIIIHHNSREIAFILDSSEADSSRDQTLFVHTRRWEAVGGLVSLFSSAGRKVDSRDASLYFIISPVAVDQLILTSMSSDLPRRSISPQHTIKIKKFMHGVLQQLFRNLSKMSLY